MFNEVFMYVQFEKVCLQDEYQISTNQQRKPKATISSGILNKNGDITEKNNCLVSSGAYPTLNSEKCIAWFKQFCEKRVLRDASAVTQFQKRL